MFKGNLKINFPSIFNKEFCDFNISYGFIFSLFRVNHQGLRDRSDFSAGTINSNLDSISESLSMLDSNGYKHLALLNGCAGTVIYIKIKGAYILTGFVYAVNVWIANLPEGPSNIYPDQTAKILAISEAGGISVGYVNNVAGITVPNVGNYYIYGIIHTG